MTGELRCSGKALKVSRPNLKLTLPALKNAR